MDEVQVQPSKSNTEGDELRVLLAETNSEDSTYDGIDWGGERVAAEVCLLLDPTRLFPESLLAILQVYEEIQKVEKDGKKVVKFSITGYSLGGLVVHYVVGY